MDFVELDLKQVTEDELIHAIDTNNQKLVEMQRNIKALEGKKHPSKKIEEEKISEFISYNNENLEEKEIDDQDFENEIDYYFSMINNISSLEDLFHNVKISLPIKKKTNYKNIILRIKMELLKNIKEVEELLGEEKNNLTKEDLEEFKAEIKLNTEKLNAITQIENSSDTIEEEVVENNLIFVPTSSGNIRILEELSDIDQEYLEGFKGLIDSIKDGSFKNVKRFNSVNNKNSGVSEVKDYKIRVVFDRIGPKDYALITAFIKKSDNDKGYLESLNLKVRNYENQKENIKSSLGNSEFLQLQESYTNELEKILENTSKNNYSYRKIKGGS